MLQLTTHDDVIQAECSTVMSRAWGYRVSVYLARGVLVDTAFPLAGGVVARWVEAVRPRGALVTHWHEDHAGNVARLAARGLPIGMAPATLARLHVTEPIGLYRRATWGVAPRLVREPLAFSDDALRLLAAPGHTADHHVVWDAERETMFGGDLFIGVKVRIAHHHEDVRQQVRTLRAIAALRPRRFFDAHRGLLADAAGLLVAKADWIEGTIAAVEDRVRRGWPDEAISREVLGPGDLTGLVSRDHYSKLNLVRTIRDSMA